MYKINKVVPLKLQLTLQTRTKLDSLFSEHVSATSLLFNEIVCWGNDIVYSNNKSILSRYPVYDNDGNLVENAVDTKSMRLNLFSKYTDNSITFDVFSKCLELWYRYFVGSLNSRFIVTAIYSSRKSKVIDSVTMDDIMSTSSVDSKNLDIFDFIYPILLSCGYLDHLKSEVLAPSEKYSVVGNVYRMLTSWVECDRMCNERYTKESQSIDSELSNIDAANLVVLEKFFNYCVNNDIIHHFDSRIHSYLIDCIIPAIKSGFVTDEHFYINKKNGEKIPYNLDVRFYDYIRNNISNVDIIVDKLYILEQLINHSNNHEHAFYPFMDSSNAHSRVQYYLGDNYTKYNFYSSIVSSELNDISVDDTEFINGNKVDRLVVSINRGLQDRTPIDIPIHSRDSYKVKGYTPKTTHKPNSYFSDMSLWSIKGKCTNLLEFSNKGRMVRALIKEPAITYSDGNYFIRMNMTVVQELEDLGNEDLKWYLSSALPVGMTNKSKIVETDKNKKRLENLKGCTFKLMGVDLGHRNPFSYSIGETTIDGAVNTIKILSEGSYESEDIYGDDYWLLYRNMKSFGQLIGMIKGLSKSIIDGNEMETDSLKEKIIKNPGIEKLIFDAKKFYLDNNMGNTKTCIAYNKFSNCNVHKSIFDYIHSLGGNLSKLYNNYNKVLSPLDIIFKYIKISFGMLKDKRRLHIRDNMTGRTKVCQEFQWLKVVEQMKRITRSKSYLGTDNDRTPIVLKTLTKYYNGCKDNYLKVICAEIVKVALDNECGVIVMEELNQNMTITTMNKRNENFLQSLWSPARIRSALENAASWYGIEIADVNESQTSKVHFESGKYGQRGSGKDSDKLYYEDFSGTIQTTHADTNAAKNILKKFVTRYEYTTQINLKRLLEKKKDSLGDEQNSNKRLYGFLTYKFGSVENAKSYFNNLFPNICSMDYFYVYYHDGSWITQSDLKSMQESIKDRIILVSKKSMAS